MTPATERTALVDPERKGEQARSEEGPQSVSWNFAHFLMFITGGVTFICGSIFYYFPDSEDALYWGALLYVVGSCGFLGVDVLEFFTFSTAPFLLRCNIFLSMVGSAWYVVGSAGFLPAVGAVCAWVGPYGFIIGSAFIGTSQLWKSYRIACGGDERNSKIPSCEVLRSQDGITQIGVELNAGIGAWFFFVSTWWYWRNANGSNDMTVYFMVVNLWVTGSLFFSLGALFLGYRHFVMRV